MPLLLLKLFAAATAVAAAIAVAATSVVATALLAVAAAEQRMVAAAAAATGQTLVPAAAAGHTVKLQAPSLLPAPLPKALQSPKMTTPLFAQGRKGAAARALHYDDNDDCQREIREAKTGDSGDYSDRSRYYNGMSSYV